MLTEFYDQMASLSPIMIMIGVILTVDWYGKQGAKKYAEEGAQRQRDDAEADRALLESGV